MEKKTIQKDINKYIIPPCNKFVIVRINNYTQSSNGIRIRNNSEITNFDCNNIYIPNDNNIRFRAKSVIMHFAKKKQIITVTTLFGPDFPFYISGYVLMTYPVSLMCEILAILKKA